MTDAKADAPKGTDIKADAPKVETRAAETRAADETSHARSASTEKVGTYRVSAPYVTLKSKSEAGGDQVLGYYEGALVPASVDLDDLARLIRKGMVERLDGPELKTVKAQQAEAEKAAEAEEQVDNKEGAEAVKEAEADRAAAEKAADEEVAKAKKERTPLLRASDSPRGSKTAQTG